MMSPTRTAADWRDRPKLSTTHATAGSIRLIADVNAAKPRQMKKSTPKNEPAGI